MNYLCHCCGNWFQYDEVIISLDGEVTCCGCAEGFEEEMKQLAHGSEEEIPDEL